MIRALVALSILMSPLLANAADCHAALVLALDRSDSVDAHEAALQRRGLAEALRDRAVRSAITPRDGLGAALMVFEWNNPSNQHVLAPWTYLASSADINAFAKRIATAPDDTTAGQTAIGAAMRYAARAFDRAPDCDRRLIDMSGDGPGNTGEPPSHVRRDGVLNGITVNGLVIRNPELDSAQPPGRDPLPYYQKHIKHGPGAFVIVIGRFEDYANAMKRKLLRELSPSFAAAK